MGKYDGLRDELLTHPAAAAVWMTFEDVSAAVGGLPPSAYRHTFWWLNEHDGTHVQARAWSAAGRAVEYVSLDEQRVRFSRRR